MFIFLNNTNTLEYNTVEMQMYRYDRQERLIVNLYTSA